MQTNEQTNNNSSGPFTASFSSLNYVVPRICADQSKIRVSCLRDIHMIYQLVANTCWWLKKAVRKDVSIFTRYKKRIHRVDHHHHLSADGKLVKVAKQTRLASHTFAAFFSNILDRNWDRFRFRLVAQKYEAVYNYLRF